MQIYIGVRKLNSRSCSHQIQFHVMKQHSLPSWRLLINWLSLTIKYYIAKQQNEIESTDQLEGDEEGIQQESVWKKKKRDLER